MTLPTILVSTTSGLSSLNSNEVIAFHGKAVRALTANWSGLFAIVADHTIWRSPVSATGWEMIAEIEHQACSLLGLGDQVLVGTEEAHLYRIDISGSSTSPPKASIVEGFETTRDRKNWSTPWGGPPAVRSLAADSEGVVYVNVHVGGVLVSSADASWAQTIDIGSDVHEIYADHDSSALFAPSGRGFAERRDGGQEWRFSTEGLDFPYMRAVTVVGQTVLASASDGPHGGRGAVYRRSVRSDEPFSKCTNGLPEWFRGNVDTFSLRSGGHALADTPWKGSVVIGAPGGSVYHSPDYGESWSQVADSIGEITSVLVLPGAT